MFALFRGNKRGSGRVVRQQSARRRSRPCLEPLEGRMLMSASSLVFPGADGHLQYVPDAQGNVIYTDRSGNADSLRVNNSSSNLWLAVPIATSRSGSRL